jgi:hypothetical protein
MKPLERAAPGAARLRTLAAVAALVVAVAACADPVPSPSASTPTSTPAASAPGTPAPVTPSPTATPPAETDVCMAKPMKTLYIGIDPCPLAIAAVRAVVAPLGLPVARMVLQPQPFDCGDLWPVGSPAVCPGPFVITGTTMHGWVTFVGSDKVAAVSLRLQGAMDPSPPPSPMWIATMEAFEVPPAGWMMP